ncbi:hypothetical protein OH76DRAFT_616474 [Lentinus brumalis]|uniref:Uncharacterized protein n=1 Tax=Lentinus brumalis TaxID=2498619 RepID=A0A371D8W6_9APHY|nr:hypothetical protein OH76DRAFT_616474 [Polyporus brumalis]
MSATRSTRKRAEARAVDAVKPRAQGRKAAEGASEKRQGSSASSRITKTPARQESQLVEKHLQHLRVLHTDAPEFCGVIGCDYYIGTTLEQVNAKVITTRDHVRDHYAPKRNAQGELDPEHGKRDFKVLSVCLWPGCEDDTARDVNSLTRHTEEDHLGWRYKCPDRDFHAGSKVIPTFCRADALTTHVKKFAEDGHMLKGDILAMLNRLNAQKAAQPEEEGEKENREPDSDVFSVVPDAVRDMSPPPDLLGNSYEPEVKFHLAYCDAIDDQYPSEDVLPESDHATPDSSFDPLF